MQDDIGHRDGPRFGVIVPLDIKRGYPWFLLEFIHSSCPVVTNGRFEAASESKVKNAKQIILYALAFLCFSQKLCGKSFNLFGVCVFPCFLNVSVIKSFISFPRTFTPTASHA